jgi:hypothetical protein
MGGDDMKPIASFIQSHHALDCICTDPPVGQADPDRSSIRIPPGALSQVTRLEERLKNLSLSA